MALHLENSAPAGAGRTVKLNAKEYGEDVSNLAAAIATKREAEAAARAADGTVKALTAKLLAAMGDAPAATCGHAVLTRKETKAAEAALTMTSGEKIAWAKVSGLTIGNSYVNVNDIRSIYGGRDGSSRVEVAGTVF